MQYGLWGAHSSLPPSPPFIPYLCPFFTEPESHCVDLQLWTLVPQAPEGCKHRHSQLAGLLLVCKLPWESRHQGKESVILLLTLKLYFFLSWGSSRMWGYTRKVSDPSTHTPQAYYLASLCCCFSCRISDNCHFKIHEYWACTEHISFSLSGTYLEVIFFHYC